MLQLDLTKEFVGKRALVTGSSRGIGAAVAQRLAVAKGLTIPEPFPHRKHFKGKQPSASTTCTTKPQPRNH